MITETPEGIHNEPGHQRSSPIPKLNKLVEEMVEMLTNPDDSERSFLPFKHDKKDRIVLMVNNLGGTGELEMGAIAAAAILELQRRGFTIDRVLVGTFMVIIRFSVGLALTRFQTSLNMPGVSLTLLILPSQDEASPYSLNEILTFLDAKTSVTSWKFAVKLTPPHKKDEDEQPESEMGTRENSMQRKVTTAEPKLFVRVLQAVCDALKTAEPEITRMDQVGGDGDCGITLKNGAEGVLQLISEGRITGTNLIEDVRAIADAVGDRMDGTSGALYSYVLFYGVRCLVTAFSVSFSLRSPRLCMIVLEMARLKQTVVLARMFLHWPWKGCIRTPEPGHLVAPLSTPWMHLFEGSRKGALGLMQLQRQGRLQRTLSIFLQKLGELRMWSTRI